MKRILLSLSAITCISLTTILGGCAKKGIKDPVTLDKAAGKWSINAIRYQIYDGSPTPQDSTVPWRPDPENFVIFDGVTSMQYRFNSSPTFNGTYSFIGQDSMTINMDGENTRWKVLLLTNTNFNIARTSSNLHDFPGKTVTVYQSFVR